jgi:hypothetical protein
MFNQINKNKFGGKLEVIEVLPDDLLENPAYNIIYPKDKIGGISFYQHSARKFGTKHPTSTVWWQYIMSVFHNEFGVMTNGILSDEGIEETWKPVKDLWKSYRYYIQDKFSWYESKENKRIETDLCMKRCPKEMRAY